MILSNEGTTNSETKQQIESFTKLKTPTTFTTSKLTTLIDGSHKWQMKQKLEPNRETYQCGNSRLTFSSLADYHYNQIYICNVNHNYIKIWPMTIGYIFGVLSEICFPIEIIHQDELGML